MVLISHYIIENQEVQLHVCEVEKRWEMRGNEWSSKLGLLLPQAMTIGLQQL